MGRYYLLICILGWGLSVFLNRLALERMHPVYIQACASITGICLLPFYFVFINSVNKCGNYSNVGVFYAVCAFLLSVLASISLHSYLRGGNDLGSSIALTSTYPVITIFLSYIFLGETFSNSKIFGILMIIFGSVLVNI